MFHFMLVFGIEFLDLFAPLPLYDSKNKHNSPMIKNAVNKHGELKNAKLQAKNVF